MMLSDDRWEAWGCPAWEHRQMTIGIAALCDYGNTIVLCADRQFMTGNTSGESRTGKWNNFGENWHVTYAARNVPYAFEVIMTARPAVMGLEDRVWHDVMPAIEKGYQKVRNAKAEAFFLTSWGETSESFRTTGKDRIPETLYLSAQSKMERFDLGADLLVVGFDDAAHIYTVENPGLSKDHTGLGFWAIGTGAPAAIANLFSRQCSFHCHVEEALYLVYESKIYAESATVGQETDLFVIAKNHPPIRIEDTHIATFLDPVWRDLRPRAIEPQHLLTVGKTPALDTLRNLHRINNSKVTGLIYSDDVKSLGGQSS
jgi:hypothetical protein